MNKKEKWLDLAIEDKMLFVLEYSCYLFATITLIVAILLISKEHILENTVLFLIVLGLFGCGKSAKSSRNMHLTNQGLKFNKIV